MTACYVDVHQSCTELRSNLIISSSLVTIKLGQKCNDLAAWCDTINKYFWYSFYIVSLFAYWINHLRKTRIKINSFVVLSRYGALNLYFTLCLSFSTGIAAFLHSRFTSASMFFKRQQIYVEWSERHTYTHMYCSSCFLSLLSVHASLV